jgi:glycosyltransferase involved in cell wall biosynthesis
MDVFVLASVAEGMPRVLLEAMAAGVPCIATRVGGIPEVLNNNEFGTLVVAEDANALAEAMLKSAMQPEQDRSEMTEKAKRRILNEYSHDVIIQRLENIYEMEYKAAKQSN